jgi:hypothetical protein
VSLVCLHLQDPGKHAHKCHHPECGRTYASKHNLTEHLLWHQRSETLVCKWPGCGKLLSNLSNLREHVKIHKGDKPYPCEVCNKRFYNRWKLQRHSRIHRRKMLDRTGASGSRGNGESGNDKVPEETPEDSDN